MLSKASIKYLRISPRKVRIVADMIRGLQVQKALDCLKFSQKDAAKPLVKLVRSAIANASSQKGVDVDNLYVKTINVNEGPTLKRWMPRARGMASPIRKKASHVNLVLDEK
jgi:large subunit ribosomal protein L22